MSRLDQTPFEIAVTGLTHDGRGVARRESGKAVFIAGALPGERVMAQQTARQRSFDEARTVAVLEASPDRVQPRCPHFGVCGGCALQHLDEAQQIHSKQRVLLENLERIGHVTPETVLPPLKDASWGYRRKGRFSVRRVEKKGKTLVGFREQDPRFVADISECHTVIPQIGMKVAALATLIDGMQARSEIPQVEFIAGDETVALVFRHLVPLVESDRAALVAFARAHGFAIFLQPGGNESVHALWPESPRLAFRLPQWDVELLFRPLDFIQVNAGLNQTMIASALSLLDAQPGDRVLDLFCGLGNFTLALARRAGRAVGVEGEAALIERARANARRNGIGNAEFHVANLAAPEAAAPWLRHAFSHVLLDPPRTGAREVLGTVATLAPQRVLYISCHPGSLARDLGVMVNEHGMVLEAAGVVDMFPHTTHVESIALLRAAPERAPRPDPPA